ARGDADPRGRLPAARGVDPRAALAADVVGRGRGGAGGHRRAPLPARRPRARMTDVIVVGSGPGGANAAARLVEAGRRVLMLDYGNRDERYAPLIPDRPFSELRRTDGAQYRYLLGDRFEGVPFGAVKVGAQLTPPRMHVLADAPEPIRGDAEQFAVSMSLARGGLGAA